MMAFKRILVKFQMRYLSRLANFEPRRKNTYKTVGHVLKWWYTKFCRYKISEPRQSIEYILAHHLGSKNVFDVHINRNKHLSFKEELAISKMCRKRLKNMPIQYILGEWDFRDLTLKMEPPVFIPRPETEILVELILKEIDIKNVKHVLELCCGSGAISCSLLHSRPHLRLTAIDRSQPACALTKYNAQSYQLLERLCVIQSEISEKNQLNFIQEKFDIIVSNPPYVLSKDMDNLQPEIYMYEDLKALHGGENGLDIIKLILNISSRILNLHGKLFLEVDLTHPECIKTLLQREQHLNLAVYETHKDFCEKERFIEIIKVA